MGSKPDIAIAPVHPHDEGLPQSVIRKRRRFRRIGYWMLLAAVLSAIPGWFIYVAAVIHPLSSGQNHGILSAVLGYGLLIISSITLVLGLWYLLLAQVRRLARMVEGSAEGTVVDRLRCANCGWPCEAPDRFCRHCGKPLGPEGSRVGSLT